MSLSQTIEIGLVQWRSHGAGRTGDRAPYSGWDRLWDLRKTVKKFRGFDGLIEEDSRMKTELVDDIFFRRRLFTPQISLCLPHSEILATPFVLCELRRVHICQSVCSMILLVSIATRLIHKPDTSSRPTYCSHSNIVNDIRNETVKE